MSYPRPIVMANDDQLGRFLFQLNDAGYHPVVAGIEQEGRSFIAILTDSSGDNVTTEVLWDSPWATELDYQVAPEDRCDECGGITRKQSLTDIDYPVTILVNAPESFVPEGGADGLPIEEAPVEQPDEPLPEDEEETP